MQPESSQTDLYRIRDELKSRNRTAEMLPVQQAILAEAQASGRASEIARAQNYLSVIQLRLGQVEDAEVSAREALSAYALVDDPSTEVLGCYQCVLAHTLAAQGQFAGAVEAAELGFRYYAVYHTPPDDFLAARARDLAALRRGEEPAPLEW